MIVPTGEEDEQVLDTDFKVDVVKRVKQDNQTSIQDAQTARHRANFALVQEKSELLIYTRLKSLYTSLACFRNDSFDYVSASGPDWKLVAYYICPIVSQTQKAREYLL